MKSIKKKIKSWHHQLKTWIHFPLFEYIYSHPLEREVWNLDITFCQWIVPRLELFIKHDNGHPTQYTPDEWNNILDKMIEGFKTNTDRDEFSDVKDADKKLKEAHRLFSKNYLSLWW